MQPQDSHLEWYSDNLRKIKPYHQTRNSFAKGRWLGLFLLDVLSKEFQAFGRNYYQSAIKSGQYRIIRKGVPLSIAEILESPIQNKDVIEIRNHNHEPPVRQWCDHSEEQNDSHDRIAGMDILHQDSDLLVINKPSGIPVHPTGQYFKNTVTEILKSHGVSALPCYRLDKITSGVLIMAKNHEKAGDIQAKIRLHEMSKLYLARVDGKFDKYANTTLNSENWTEHLDKILNCPNLKVTESSSVYSIDLKRNFPAAFQPSREACTEFYPIKYYKESDQSLVLCKPKTGRTHQIRIHLARLNRPISNDSFYNIKNSPYNLRTKYFRDVIKWEDYKDDMNELKERFNSFVDENDKVRSKLNEFDQDVICQDCGLKLLQDPDPSKLQLYLHAWRYSDNTENFTFETTLPNWAI